MSYVIETLPNGVRLVTEPMDYVRSASMGIWVATGSRAEQAGESGAAHFIEHMLFKGTYENTAAQLAARMDAIGGQFNAFTTKECTCFHVHALGSHLMEGLDILTGMFFRSKFDQRDVETERGVVLEEIGMYQDDPADVVSERLAAAVFKGTPLARPILGRRASLENMTGDWLRAYKESHYLPDKVVVSLAGSYPQEVVDAIRERFSAMAPGQSPKLRPGRYTPAVTLKRRSTEQNQLMIAFPGVTSTDPRRYTLQVMSTVLGGGMSSRLLQQVRERQGLCYNVYSYGSSYADVGVYCIATAQSRDTESRAIASIRQVVDELAADGITAEELRRARELAKASVLMGMESTFAHMNMLARAVLNHEAILSPDDIIAAYDSVTLEQVQTMAASLFRWENASLSAVGRVMEREAYQELIAP